MNFFPGSGSGFDFFNLIALLFPIIFILVFSVFFIAIIKGLKQWNYNNKQPQLTVQVKVVSKRTDYHNHTQANQIRHSSTSYFVTFEVESGDRMEFQVNGLDFGQIVENDTGKLTFQGTRFKSFTR